MLCHVHPNSSLLPSSFTPLYPLLPVPTPFSPVITLLLSVSEFSFLFLLNPFTFPPAPQPLSSLTAVLASQMKNHARGRHSASVACVLLCTVLAARPEASRRWPMEAKGKDDKDTVGTAGGTVSHSFPVLICMLFSSHYSCV